ncbi:hypothetical protein [Acetivibrio cellulolyticus]|uniref:hypothetical protein n=1 Tax=Acetivibrio cellulolyticus TaxID=35830 RepID=UPI0001E2EC23|nr:hypothetical protein [Acetivibrio cellulolyticus]
MNKNLLRTCIGLTVGGSLLVTSTVMGMAAGPTGYETLKAAVKSSRTIKNATFNISGSIADSNKKFTNVNSTLKLEKDELISGAISLDSNDVNKSYSFFEGENSIIFKDDASNVYNKINFTDDESDKEDEEHDNPRVEALCENILDTLVGDLKKKVDLKKLDNEEKQISIDLDKSEIPALVNLALNADDGEDDKECKTEAKIKDIIGVDPLKLDLPELTNIEADKINVEIVVDKNNIVKEMDLVFDITGNDAQNKVHNQELKLSVDVGGINSTSVDTVDLSGKEVREISDKDFDQD